MTRYIALVVLIAAMLPGCSSSDPAHPLSRNDRIQDGLVRANAHRAGESGVPVQLISIASADDDSFSAVLSDDKQQCRYTIQGSLQGDKVSVAKQISRECGGANPTPLVGELLPRNKLKDRKACNGSERERLLCFAETDYGNRELVLAITG